MKIIHEANRIRLNIQKVQMQIDGMREYFEELRDKNCPEEVKLSVLLETCDYIKEHLDEIVED